MSVLLPLNVCLKIIDYWLFLVTSKEQMEILFIIFHTLHAT